MVKQRSGGHGPQNRDGPTVGSRSVTKTDARAQAKDCRAALRDAFAAFEQGRYDDAVAFANEAAGRAGEVEVIFRELAERDGR